MPVKKGKNGERSVEAEAEVPGSPEDVWRAIATGPGISSWFVPSTVDGRVNGRATANFGPGMDSVATITHWDPPRRYVAETVEEPGAVATEWIVEARSGGTCIVRVVHRWFASTDNWDDQFEGHTYGWAAFFRILRQYLTHFAGQECSAVPLAAVSPAPVADTWRALTGGLLLNPDTRRASSIEPLPDLAGEIVHRGPESYPELLLRLDRPSAGLAHMFVMSMCGPTLLTIRFYLYGPGGAAAAAPVQRAWEHWLADRFPQMGRST